MKNKYIITCSTPEDAIELFRSLEILGFPFGTEWYNIEDNYSWDVHRSRTLYCIELDSHHSVCTYGTKEYYKPLLDYGDYVYCDPKAFASREVRWYHRLKYKVRKYFNR